MDTAAARCHSLLLPFGARRTGCRRGSAAHDDGRRVQASSCPQVVRGRMQCSPRSSRHAETDNTRPTIVCIRATPFRESRRVRPRRTEKPRRCRTDTGTLRRRLRCRLLQSWPGQILSTLRRRDASRTSWPRPRGSSSRRRLGCTRCRTRTANRTRRRRTAGTTAPRTLFSAGSQSSRLREWAARGTRFRTPRP